MPNNRIAPLRREHDMNQKELGQQLGVAQTTVSAWETGKTEPDSAAMGKMAQLFHVSIGYLMGYEPESHTRGLSKAEYDALIKERLIERDRQEFMKMVETQEREGEPDEETLAEYFDLETRENYEKAGKPDTLEGFLVAQLVDEQPFKRRIWLHETVQQLLKIPEA